MKKTISLLLAILICVTAFSSCTAKGKTVQVGSATVGKGIYGYFLTDVADAEMTEEEKTQAAEAAVLRYVAINTKFSELGLELTAQQKSSASKKTNNLWHLFSDYYTSAGVGKGDLYKICLNDEYRKAIIRSIYDTGGTSPVTEDAIKAYYSDNYVAFKAIIELLQTTDDDGAIIPYTDEKVAALTKQFNQMKQSMDDGTAFEKIEAAYLSRNVEDEEAESDVMLISKTDRAFPVGTFEEIMKIERDGSGVFILGGYLFLVQRVGEFKNEANYTSKRDDCLIALESENFDRMAQNWADSLK
jgi:hypothetical protein